MNKITDIKKINILGVNIACIDMDKTIEVITSNLNNIKGEYVCLSNVHTIIMANENSEYTKVQNSSYLSLPDGKPLSIIGKKRGFDIDRVTGPDLMIEILKLSQINGYKHYFYGNTQENLEKFIEKIKVEYPKLDIVGYLPSVFRELTVQENNTLVEEINNSKADFVWVGLGAPRQEIFAYKNKGKINGLMIGVGGAFNVISGLSKRAPKWMQKACLEWLFRLIDDPKRLWKRYLTTNTKFIYYIIKKRKIEYIEKKALG